MSSVLLKVEGGGAVLTASLAGAKRKSANRVAKQRVKVNRRVCVDGQERVMRCLTMSRKYIHQIRDGEKTVEGRIFKGPVVKYNVGDCVRFYYYTNAKDDVQCVITDKKCFKTFKAMLEDVGFKNCIPKADTLEGAVQMYHKIPRYKERAAEFGVVALSLRVIESRINLQSDNK